MLINCLPTGLGILSSKCLIKVTCLVLLKHIICNLNGKIMLNVNSLIFYSITQVQLLHCRQLYLSNTRFT